MKQLNLLFNTFIFNELEKQLTKEEKDLFDKCFIFMKESVYFSQDSDIEYHHDIFSNKKVMKYINESEFLNPDFNIKIEIINTNSIIKDFYQYEKLFQKMELIYLNDFIKEKYSYDAGFFYSFMFENFNFYKPSFNHIMTMINDFDFESYSPEIKNIIEFVCKNEREDVLDIIIEKDEYNIYSKQIPLKYIEKNILTTDMSCTVIHFDKLQWIHSKGGVFDLVKQYFDVPVFQGDCCWIVGTTDIEIIDKIKKSYFIINHHPDLFLNLKNEDFFDETHIIEIQQTQLKKLEILLNNSRIETISLSKNCFKK